MLISSMREVAQRLQEANACNRPVFVVAPLIRWHAELFQRPQHIARALADIGALVLFFEPPQRHLPQQVSKISSSLFVLPEPAFDEIIATNSGFWVDIYSTSAMPADRAEWIRSCGHKIIYEYVDEIDPAVSSQADKCHELFLHFADKSPDITIVTAAKLRKDLDAAWRDRAEIILSPNAADPTHFEDAWRFPRNTEAAKALREKSGGRPIVGYYGALADWIDFDVIYKLALSSPDMYFCYVGPKYRPTIQLPTAANIDWTGAVEYSVLPALASAFDVATIPFKSGSVAKATSPLKLYEYFALRLPVVVNKDMGECLQFDYVGGAETPEEYREKIRQALRLRHSDAYEFFCKVTVAQNTWALRARHMLESMTRDLVSQPAPPRLAVSSTDLSALLTLPSADPVTLPRRRVVLPGDTIESAEMALAEAFTGDVATTTAANQIAAESLLRQDAQKQFDGRSRDTLLSERKDFAWKTSKMLIWPAVRPSVSIFHARHKRLALIADEFTSALLAYDADVTNLMPDSAVEQIRRQDFDMLLVESVWFGHRKSWNTLWKDAVKGTGLFAKLVQVVNACRSKGIPTVFWNKEDPEHYDLFLPIARLFDHVYTTEGACIEVYRADLGHSRVGSLVFAAQPRLQNPISQTDVQRRGVAFAGSWYHGKHAYRAEQQAALLKAGLRHGVQIYDRSLRDSTGQFVYPPEFRRNVVGTLDFHRVCTAYRQYDVFLNVNTVSDSDTMCARRVFEVAASRTAMVSTPSRAVTRFFGDGIKVGEGIDFFDEAIRNYLENPATRARDAHLIFRETHRHHTYGQRLIQIFADVGQVIEDEEAGQVVVLADATDTPDSVMTIAATLVAQSNRPALVVLAADIDEVTASLVTELLSQQEIGFTIAKSFAEAVEFTAKAVAERALKVGRDAVALFHAGSSYGPEYLADQMLAKRLGGAELVAKSKGKSPREYQFGGIGVADPRALLVDVGLFVSSFGEGKEAVTAIDVFLFDLEHRAGPRQLLLSDQFNFSRSGPAETL